MTGLSDVASDERTARMVLFMLVEPNGEVTGLDSLNAHVWCDHFNTLEARSITERLNQVRRSGVRARIPGDAHWPGALNDLGDTAPYVLWVRGVSSFLSRPLPDFVTITGARVSTSYGERIARELVTSVVAGDQVVVAGGAYGIEGVAHQAALAGPSREGTGSDHRTVGDH